MIDTTTARATALKAGKVENNPAILWNDLFAGGTASTDTGTEQTGGEAANASSGFTFDYWSALESSNAAAWSADLGSAASLSCASIVAHNIGTLGGSVVLQSSADAATWSDVSGTVSPSDDSAILLRFAPTSARYWRVYVSGLAASDVVSIGVLIGGRELILPRRIYQGYTPPITPTRVTLSANMSEGGHRLGQLTRRTGSAANVSLTNVDPSFVRGDWAEFQTYANAGGGFAWAWRPEKYGDCHYSWVTAPIVPTNSGPRDLMTVDLTLGFYDG